MRWENRVFPLALLLAAALVLSLPLWASLVDEALVEPPASSPAFREFQEHSGFVGLGLVLAVLSLSLRRLPWPWLPFRPRSRGLHILLGLAALTVVVLHTGGAWGSRIHGWLVTSLLGAMFIALVGKLAENRRLAARDSRVVRIHTLWLSAHLLVVAAFLVLLVFHVAAVYYY